VGGHLTTVVAVGGIGGSPEPVERLLGDLPETGADVVVMVGDLGCAGTARRADELQKALIFATPPAHKGLGEPGSEVLAELINTYRPRLAIVGGDEPAEHLLGRTLVVCPGRLDQGRYGLIDMREHTFVAATIGAGRPATV
jgi:hypothetical protein